MSAALRDDQHSEIHPLDLHVGQRLRMRRLRLDLTQEKLAKMVGLTFQQVQKYEHGQNRISASRLFEIAGALNVPVTYFFDDAPNPHPTTPGMGETGQEPLDAAPEKDINLSSRETADLVRAYYRVEDAKKRKQILNLIRAMSDDDAVE
jgi:transcriptional regulator with XRE-family HTH domain